MPATVAGAGLVVECACSLSVVLSVLVFWRDVSDTMGSVSRDSGLCDAPCATAVLQAGVLVQRMNVLLCIVCLCMFRDKAWREVCGC